MANLGDIYVVVRLPQAWPKLSGQAGGSNGLHSKGCIPQLAAIVALHLHAVFCHPQEVIYPRYVPAHTHRKSYTLGMCLHTPTTECDCYMAKHHPQGVVHTWDMSAYNRI